MKDFDYAEVRIYFKKYLGSGITPKNVGTKYVTMLKVNPKSTRNSCIRKLKKAIKVIE